MYHYIAKDKYLKFFAIFFTVYNKVRIVAKLHGILSTKKRTKSIY